MLKTNGLLTFPSSVSPSNARMEWTIEKRGDHGFSQVVLEGDFDLYNAPSFARAMMALMAEGPRRISLDLSLVGYLDSSGVGAIIKLVQEARRTSVDLRFRGIAGSPRKVLRMSNILPLLREEESGAVG